jgi:hypothetical protein
MPLPLYPQGKSPRYPLDRRLGGPQSCSVCSEEKNSQPPPGIEPQNPDRSVRSPELYRLSYHGAKIKVSLCLTKLHAVTTYWGSGSIAPLNAGTRWRWLVNFTPRPLCPQCKRTRYQLNRRLGVPQSHSGRGGEEMRWVEFNEKCTAANLTVKSVQIRRQLLEHNPNGRGYYETSWSLSLHNVKDMSM